MAWSHSAQFMKGDWVVRRKLEGEYSLGLCASDGKEVRFLHDDTSLMKTFDCASSRTGSSGVIRGLYSTALWVYGQTKVLFQNEERIECDDDRREAGYQFSGNWQFFVR